MAADPASTKFQWGQFITYLGSFCVLILVAGLLVGMALGLRPLEDRAAKVVSLAIPRIEISLPNNGVTAEGKAGSWLPKSNQEQIEQLAYDALGNGSEVFSREPLERVANALSESGWFEGSPTVERSSNGLIKVKGQWRVPGAVVRFKDSDYLISWDGKRMPSVDRVGLQKSFRVIMGPSVGPPTLGDVVPDYRSSWAGEDIVAGLELLHLMSDKPWFNQISGIDVSDYSAHSKLTLVTTEQTRVVWGGRPTRPLIGEVSTAQKLAHLSQIAHDHKRIDAGYPLIYINSATLQFDISASATQP